MAEAQLSGILSTLSGTIGNFNFGTTKNGIIVADLPKRSASTASPDQVATRTIFSTSTKAWKNLGDAQRLPWVPVSMQSNPNGVVSRLPRAATPCSPGREWRCLDGTGPVCRASHGEKPKVGALADATPSG